MSPKTILACFLTLVGAITIGLADLVASEVQVPVAMLLGFGVLLGLLHPSRSWVFALALGVSVFCAHALAAIAGYRPPYEVEPNLLATFLALLPAALGVAVGTFVARLRSQERLAV